MLNARELVRAVKDSKVIENKDDQEKNSNKLLEWDGKYKDVETTGRLEALFAPLSQPRVNIKSSLSEAVWDEAQGQVVVTKNSGQMVLGPTTPEEALFALENNSLLLTRNSIPLSLQMAYTLLVSSKTGLSQDMYLVYSKLTREGFKLVRTSQENNVTSDQLPLDVLVCEDDDIDQGLIDPLYGAELFTHPQNMPPAWLQDIRDSLVPHLYPQSSQESINEHSLWIEEIIVDLTLEAVERSLKNERKRKHDGDTDETSTSKSARIESLDFISLSASPKYEIDSDHDDEDDTLFCLRCLKRHEGGEADCRANEVGCWLCGRVGHYKVVHTVTDEQLRTKISQFLNISKYDLWEKYDPEVVTLEQSSPIQDEPTDDVEPQHEDLENNQDNNEEQSNINNSKDLYMNPFHESVDLEDEDEDEAIVEVLDEAGSSTQVNDDIRGNQNKMPNAIQNQQFIHTQQNINALVAAAINHQVSSVEALQAKLDNSLPTKLVDSANAFVCKICDVTCNTPEMLKKHEAGQKHLKKLTRLNSHGSVSQKFSCDICGIECSGNAALIAHFKGKSHLKVMTSRAQMNAPGGISSRLQKPPSVTPTDDDDIMIVTDKISNAPSGCEDDDTDIEIITGDKKSKDEIIAEIPNCAAKQTIQLTKPLINLIPKNTWNFDGRSSREMELSKLMNNETIPRSKPAKIPKPINTIEEIDIIDDDDDEVIMVEDECKPRREVITPLTRPFRGLFPAKEFTRPLASVSGEYISVRNFGYHSRPPRDNINAPKSTNILHTLPKPKIFTSKIANENRKENDNNIDLVALAARATEWIAHKQSKKAEKASKDEDNVKDEAIRKLTEAAEQWKNKNSLKNDNVVKNEEQENIVVDLTSDEEDDRSPSSSSYYSDDIQAHSELKNFKYGPLASLWTNEENVAPLICPEMGGSLREIYNRLRMEPPENKIDTSLDEDNLEVVYDVFLAENYKKLNSLKPDYRVLIQKFTSSLPSPRDLYKLDKKFPDAVPFLFAVINGGTVSFFNVDRIELPYYFKHL